jgi:lipopolysaccharide/colanic/teichoic acid biosynthesis glycosyltransferase
LAGFFDDTLPVGVDINVGPGHRTKVLGQIDDCQVYMRNEEIDLAFLALPIRQEKTITQLMCRLGSSGYSVLMVQDLFSYAIQKARPQHLGELQIMNFCLFPRWKRVFDIVFSLIVLLGTLPMSLIIMLAIKAEDGGPIFFRHARVMEGGKRFHCLKFRSMHPDAQERLEYLLHKDPLLQEEWQARSKLKNDPRVTKVGRILRRFGFDELPQLLNVLSGEMSIVGARPVMPEELEKYSREVTLTNGAMKPGITGPWQMVSNIKGLDYADQIEMDRRYILQSSIWNDVGIILKTIWRIIFAKGT